PHIGNYGVNKEDVESSKPYLSGFAMREYTENPSNWRSTKSLADYLKENKIVGIDRVDTRKITRILRDKGAMKAVIASEKFSLDQMKAALADAPNMEGANLVTHVGSTKIYEWNEKLENKPAGLSKDAPHVVVIDCGAKYQILRYLNEEGARVTVVPFNTSEDDILRLAPNGIMISNGPGDPAAVTGLPETLRSLMGKLPMFGICLGHQLLCLAAGGETYKLKFGHHGANHPVLNKKSGKIEITSQNHGFAADGESLLRATEKHFGKLDISHVHLSDGTIEGFAMPDIQVTAIQYHPEASPGPHDASYLFKEFFACLKS
ncbi:MAG: glutamine-hydrolyzing carbamoyl-phosphate synthase small subunit, partial [Proteobacteria bacterium]|nr:glutamine-hydrolyzing carbamoyl-phosphate synthase small subunit [Pseudomonadota bacterium]